MILRLLRLGFTLAFVAAIALGGLAFYRVTRAEDARASDRDDLWLVAHNLCAAMDRLTGLPLPCLKVDREAGFIVLRAPMDHARVLVVPIRKIPGVESPLLLLPDAPNPWTYAWSQRDYVANGAGRPLAWSDYALAINSRRARTQDQLHIHVSCVDPRLKRYLARHAPPRDKWTTIDLAPWADRYRIKRIDEAGLRRDPFKIVAEESPGARANMAAHSLALVGYGEADAREFVLLDAGGYGHAEELLDHRC
ncbi:CDP-diacylglycerol pyrophosphatase [Rhodoblastus acidophilus]|uniref:CDP-diacylglycerol diphosphatase n=1 Tax=Rhodoblastus acidophilus TaxID=1074 RepID=UPI002224B041|nr:CDP-diacylglycerol diphosphatase [Rhodoblastus acidophilus]MCW2315432.1 CDP-diacylglycerol pyrophosphatase [Rhodoblastus acidophilus]